MRDEAAGLEIPELTEIARHDIRMLADRGRKRPGADALGQADQLRQLGGKPSVDDNQPKRQRRVRNGGEIGCRHDRAAETSETRSTRSAIRW